jgi:hypothetical protein
MHSADLNSHREHAPDTSSRKKLANELILKGIFFIGMGLVIYGTLISEEDSTSSKDE